MRPFFLGKLAVDPPFLSAPMAGFTNFAFRQMLRLLGGTGLIATEMVSARAFVHLGAKAESLPVSEKSDAMPERLWGVKIEPRPLSVQIWDNDPDALAETAHGVAHEFRASVIDLNFGCPAPKIAKNSASGSTLLRFPNRVGELVASVVAAAQGVPVTAKIRLGLTADTINAVDVAQAVEGAGAAGITIHGRTAAAMYRGTADWDEIARVAPYLQQIPLIGNGDVTTAAEAVFRLKNYPVAGVMIGRAALSRPWIFREAAALLRGAEPPPSPGAIEQKELFLTHFSLVLERFGDERGTLLMRKYAADWSRNRFGGKAFRVAVAEARTPSELLAAVESSFPQ